MLDTFKGQTSLGETGTEISNSFEQKLEGLDINMDTAKSLAVSIFIPTLMSKLSQSSSGGSLNFQDLLSQFLGKDGGIDLSAIGNLLGGTNDKSDKQDGGRVNDLLGITKELILNKLLQIKTVFICSNLSIYALTY